MQTYISILRGINVSGQKIVKMDVLKNMYQKLHFKNVQTYIQSGNVVFQTEETDTKHLEKQISGEVKNLFGFEVSVLVLTNKQLTTIFAHNPYLKGRNEDIARLHVTFLSHEPEKENIDIMKGGDYGKDELMFAGKAIYLFCPDGYGNTKLSNNFFENKLKVTATTRNWKTITELFKIGEIIAGKKA